MTPETFRNDIQNNICPSHKVVLIVFDEAHRASGNYAYCDIIKNMVRKDNIFRVLALSATPGSDGKKVQDVVDNLLIQNLELRTEDSPDVVPFIFKRSIVEVVLEPSPLLEELTKDFVTIIQPFLKKLVEFKAYNRENPRQASKYGMIQMREGWRRRKHGLSSAIQSIIEGNFAISITLIGILDKLLSNGIKSFLDDLTEFDLQVKQQKNTSKMRLALTNSAPFMNLLSKTRQRVSLPGFSSHPKMEATEKIVLEHFNLCDQKSILKNEEDLVPLQSESKIMIFSNFRYSVEEIVEFLSKHSPRIRPVGFIGQASGKSKAGLKQKEQLQVISDFQNNVYNVLVATSIGEEGLDIGEIDLIICFDVYKSPIRMLQRCGRTGRKRSGKIYLLMSKGVDEDSVKKSRNQYIAVQKSIQSSNLNMYDGHLAGMIPDNVTPSCVFENIIVQKSDSKVKAKKQSRKSICGPFLPPDLLKQHMELNFPQDYVPIELSLNSYPHWQSQHLKIHTVPISEKEKIFVSLMEYMAALRNNEPPATPNPSIQSVSQKPVISRKTKRYQINNELASFDSLSQSSSNYSKRDSYAAEYHHEKCESKNAKTSTSADESRNIALEKELFGSDGEENLSEFGLKNSSQQIELNGFSDESFDCAENVDFPITNSDKGNTFVNLRSKMVSGKETASFQESPKEDHPQQKNKGNHFFGDNDLFGLEDISKVESINLAKNSLPQELDFQESRIEKETEVNANESDDLFDDFGSFDFNAIEEAEKNNLKNDKFEVQLSSECDIVYPSRKRRVINDSSSSQIVSSSRVTPVRLSVDSIVPISPGVLLKRNTPLLERLQRKKLPRNPPSRQLLQRAGPSKKERKGFSDKIISKDLIAAEYIENEANVSSGVDVSADEPSEPDEDLSGFIDHSSINSPGLEIGFYRQSLLSPSMGGMGKKSTGKYKLSYKTGIPKKRGPAEEEEEELPSSLAEFIVGDDEVIFDTQTVIFDDETSLLEDRAAVSYSVEGKDIVESSPSANIKGQNMILEDLDLDDLVDF
jgi:Fanconi anemia group M protein